MDKHADGNYGTQICDVCEEERDQQERVYYCEECDYIAEFMCLIEVTKPNDYFLEKSYQSSIVALDVLFKPAYNNIILIYIIKNLLGVYAGNSCSAEKARRCPFDNYQQQN